MRAAVLMPDHQIFLREVPSPNPRPGQVVVAPVLVGLCGSDVSYATTGANGNFVQHEPMILGHEVCARLTSDTKIDRQSIPTGALVAVHPLWPSPLAGKSVVRPDSEQDAMSFLGSASTQPHTPGGLAELVAVRPEQLRILPEGLPAERAVLAEPLAVVLHAFSRLPGPTAQQRILICGAGPIGLLCLLVALAQGAASVTITDLHPRPLNLAATLGATTTIQAPEAPPPDSHTLAIEASGNPGALESALTTLAPHGHLLQLGMLPQKPAPTTLAALVTKELTLTGTHRFTGELDDALTFLTQHDECSQIVTHRLPLDATARAMELAGNPAAASKVVVQVEPAVR